MDEIWTDQPPIPRHPVRIHPLEYAGVAVSEKLSAVRELLLEARAWSLVVMAMDEVSRQENRDVRDAKKLLEEGVLYVKGEVSNFVWFSVCIKQEVVIRCWYT